MSFRSTNHQGNRHQRHLGLCNSIQFCKFPSVKSFHSIIFKSKTRIAIEQKQLEVRPEQAAKESRKEGRKDSEI